MAANRVLGWDVRDPVPTGAMIALRGHQIYNHAVRITEAEHLFLIAGRGRVSVDLQPLEALMPPAQ